MITLNPTQVAQAIVQYAQEKGYRKATVHQSATLKADAVATFTLNLSRSKAITQASYARQRHLAQVARCQQSHATERAYCLKCLSLSKSLLLQK